MDTLKKQFEALNPVFKDGMIFVKQKPHTPPVAHLDECCSGVVTAEYYFAARYFDKIEDKKAEEIISELKKLQDTDKSSPAFGNMRWYREEEFVFDTNGAFFILLPVSLTYKLCGDKLTAKEKADMEELLKNASAWFAHSAHGSLHYCNKIMSDGAMLALINDITGLCKEEFDLFWEKWFKYADEYGWGWGENTSRIYSQIMLTALNIAVLIGKGEFKEKASAKREKLLSYRNFHGDKEFIPSIRTYNFTGKIMYENMFDTKKEINVPHICESTMNSIIMYESQAKVSEDADKETFRKEHLFKDSYAFTWKGKNVRLGSVSHFPVMPGAYQKQLDTDKGKVTWGLAWQSMPVSAMIEDKHVSFLRMRSITNGNMHSHPVVEQYEGWRYSRLFEDGNVVVFSTRSAQDNNIAIVTRFGNMIANTASYLCDEWCIPDKDIEIREIEVSGRKWFVVVYENNAIALCPLDGTAFGSETRAPMKTTVSESGIFKTITTELYNGENKLLFTPRVESSWVIIALESKENVEEYLKGVTITDNVIPNFESTLLEQFLRREITCTDGKSTAKLFVDPENQMDI